MFVAAALCIAVFATSFVQAAFASQRTQLVEKLFSNYKAEYPPNFENDEKLDVKLAMLVTSIDSISDSGMEYKVAGYFRQKWNDSRLRFNAVEFNTTQLSLEYSWVKKVWVPDTFFVNEKESTLHKMMVPNQLLLVHNTGEVLLSSSVTLTLSCQMCFTDYPQDTQKCGILIESYSHDVNQLKLSWLDMNSVALEKTVMSPHFDVLRTVLSETVLQYPLGNWSVASVYFILQRRIGYFVSQVYMPTTILVVFSWMSFWISVDAVAVRLSIGILTALAMNQLSGLSANLPRVSYIKAIDIWISTSFLFVFAAMLEFALVNLVSHSQHDCQPPTAECPLTGADFIVENVLFEQMLLLPTFCPCFNWHHRITKTVLSVFVLHTYSQAANVEMQPLENEEQTVISGGARKAASDDNEGHLLPKALRRRVDAMKQNARKSAVTIDKVSRILFPAVYVLFVLIYWIVYGKKGSPDSVQFAACN